MIVIGIDPGTTTVGYAIAKKENNNFELIDYGVIQTKPNLCFEDKVFEIAGDLDLLIDKYNPQKAIIEKLYFTNNIKTGIDVAQARGVMIYKFKKRNINIEEYTPLQLKNFVCGNGKASKTQLQNAIKILFKLKEIPKPDDAADAIGLAYMGILSI